MPRRANHSKDGSGTSEIHVRLARESWRDGSVIKGTCCSSKDPSLIPNTMAARNHLYLQFEGPSASGLHRHLHFQERSHVQPHLNVVKNV